MATTTTLPATVQGWKVTHTANDRRQAVELRKGKGGYVRTAGEADADPQELLDRALAQAWAQDNPEQAGRIDADTPPGLVEREIGRWARGA